MIWLFGGSGGIDCCPKLLRFVIWKLSVYILLTWCIAFQRKISARVLRVWKTTGGLKWTGLSHKQQAYDPEFLNKQATALNFLAKQLHSKPDINLRKVSIRDKPWCHKTGRNCTKRFYLWYVYWKLYTSTPLNWMEKRPQLTHWIFLLKIKYNNMYFCSFQPQFQCNFNV